ncbi:MAG: ATP-binding cassette domain-containing protein [Coriobacteriaceae bacterium]
MSADVFVDFRDAAFTYDGEAFVFRHLNLTVPQGQFLCLLGGNGSGKSTLAKHINALLLPDEGEVDVFGCDTRDAEQTYFIRSNAGLVFQNPDDQLVASLIENDVAFGPENLGIPNPELRRRDQALPRWAWGFGPTRPMRFRAARSNAGHRRGACYGPAIILDGPRPCSTRAGAPGSCASCASCMARPS